METWYCIRKDKQSKKDEWLGLINGKYLFMTTYQLMGKDSHWLTFSTRSAASYFIAVHPDLCDSKNAIYTTVHSSDQIKFIPV
jgi:hypothetical protein